MDGVVRLRFMKSEPEAMALKSSIDRVLGVSFLKANDWKDGEQPGQETCNYVIARHHYTEKHILKYLKDPENYSFMKPLSHDGARKFLHSVSSKDIYQMDPSGDAFYLQCPNVSKEAVKATFLKARQQQQIAGEKIRSPHTSLKIPALTEFSSNSPKSSGLPLHSPTVEHSPTSLTVSTTRSSAFDLLVQKEEENQRLKDALEGMQSQLTFLKDMVSQLQEKRAEDSSVRSPRSSRYSPGSGGASHDRSKRHSNMSPISSHRGSSQQRNGVVTKGRNSVGSLGVVSVGVPHEIQLGEKYDDDDDITQYTRRPEDDETIVTYNQPQISQPPRSSTDCGQSVASKAVSTIFSASKSVKSLPREIQLGEDEGDDKTHGSLEEEDIDMKSVYSRRNLERIPAGEGELKNLPAGPIYQPETNGIGSSSSTSSQAIYRGSPTNDGISTNQNPSASINTNTDLSSAEMRTDASESTSFSSPNKYFSQQPQFSESAPKNRGASGNGNRNGNESATYEVKDLLMTDPHGEEGNYTGTISRETGMPHCYGLLEYSRPGCWYEGEWNHGRWTGHGRLSNGEGDFYEGGVKNDHKNGRGYMRFGDGRTFEGEYVNGQMAKGKMTYQDGSAYEGMWLDGMHHGRGYMRFNDGRTFEGEYVNGQMTKGKMTYPDGAAYEGMWLDGMRHGRGRCIFSDQSVYEGLFHEGEFCGYGRMIWSDGGSYEGEWWNGEMHGLGKEIRPNGTIRHDGQWHKGHPLRNNK